MKVKLLLLASQDLVDGYRFYEDQSPGVGEYFLDSLFADIDALMLNAGIHPVVLGTYHRMLAKHFPYAVYYRVEAETAVVYAVLDSRRSPDWIRRRLG